MMNNKYKSFDLAVYWIVLFDSFEFEFLMSCFFLIKKGGHGLVVPRQGFMMGCLTILNVLVSLSVVLFVCCLSSHCWGFVSFCQGGLGLIH